ncbi:MAG TPA: exosortase/archaeosortase family protein [Verrucomicrobiae bacterium]
MNAEAGSFYPAQGGVKHSTLRWLMVLLPFAWLWFHLIGNLRLQWGTDPQYSYGLVMPLLTAGLLIRRWYRFSGVPLPDDDSKKSPLWAGLIVCLTFPYLPTRLLEEAVPEWRPDGWLLAIETIGLTLCAIYLAKGRAGVLRFAFPICFFFTAVPWPTLFEQPIIQHLSRINAGMVVNVLGILDVPAIQHGNVIEVSTGLVGINDACSGIRSLQSSLMISLFLGEFYFMNWTRRILLMLTGFILAMFFNVCRTSLLTFLAAKKGIAAIAQYHDEAGVTILLACTATLLGVSYLASVWRKHSATGRANITLPPPISHFPRLFSSSPSRRLRSLAFGLIIWILFVEAGVATWYYICDSHIKAGPAWSISLPESNSTLKSLPFTPEEHELLRFDDGKQGQWQEADGTVWQAYYFDWLPGRVAGYLAKRHTPDICLPAMGLNMVSGPTLTMLNVHGLVLPMRGYVFAGPNGPLQVFQCHWQPGEDSKAYAYESSRFNLIRSIWAGRGDKGQKVIEIVITGYDNPDSAREAMVRELQQLIRVDKT